MNPQPSCCIIVASCDFKTPADCDFSLQTRAFSRRLDSSTAHLLESGISMVSRGFA
jgi:hypothetical protein